MKAAVDNDILHKGACFGLLNEVIGAIPAELAEIGILGAARFVVRAKITRAKLARGPEPATQALDAVVERAMVLEPTGEEERFAAELEYTAQLASLNLDEGESLLCAIVVLRVWSWLVTGDKRAVGGLETVLRGQGRIDKLAGKVLCLEQLLLRLLSLGNPNDIRRTICIEPNVDRAVAICFSCSNPDVGPESWSEGLRSYIADLRKAAPVTLAT